MLLLVSLFAVAVAVVVVVVISSPSSPVGYAGAGYVELPAGRKKPTGPMASP